MKPKVVVIDLDGTLFNSDKLVSQRNLNALRAIKEQGIEIVFATARPPRAVAIEDIDVSSFGTMIYYNGAYTESNLISYSNHISINADLSVEVINYIHSLDDKAELSVEILDNWYSFKEINYKESEFMNVNHNPKVIELDYIKSKELTKILITNFSYSSELKEKYNNVLNIIETDNSQLVQIMDKEAGKDKAVDCVVKKMGYDMSEVMCFGDDYNDLSLFKVCGYSVAMANGISELKSIATLVTKTNDEDGVGIVLEKILS